MIGPAGERGQTDDQFPVLAPAGGLTRRRVLAARAHHRAAVGGEHDQPLPLGHGEDRLAGACGGGLGGLGEGPEGVAVRLSLSAAPAAPAAPAAGLGDDDPERRVEQPAVQVAGDRRGA